MNPLHPASYWGLYQSYFERPEGACNVSIALTGTAEKSERVQTKTKKIQGAQGGTSKGTPSDELKLEETLETTVGPTLSSLIYAQGWALSDQRVATLIKGIVDPRVGEVLEELLVEILE